MHAFDCLLPAFRTEAVRSCNRNNTRLAALLFLTFSLWAGFLTSIAAKLTISVDEGEFEADEPPFKSRASVTEIVASDFDLAADLNAVASFSDLAAASEMSALCCGSDGECATTTLLLLMMLWCCCWWSWESPVEAAMEAPCWLVAARNSCNCAESSPRLTGVGSCRFTMFKLFLCRSFRHVIFLLRDGRRRR